MGANACGADEERAVVDDGGSSAALDAFMRSLGEFEDEEQGERCVPDHGPDAGVYGERSFCAAANGGCGVKGTSPDSLSQQPLNPAGSKPSGNDACSPARSCDGAPSQERQYTRDIYRADASVESLSLSEVVVVKKRLGIETTGLRVPKPIGSFVHLTQSVVPALLKRLQKLGCVEPMPVQCQVMPVLLQGRNSIVMGEDGCGKTLSYMVPMICHVLSLIREWRSVAGKRCAYCVIMALTRESSSRIYTMLAKLLKSLHLRVALITTGYDNYKQVVSGAEFLIVTPAKLFDLVKQRCLTLSGTNYVAIEDFPKIYHKHPDEIETLLNLGNAVKVVVSNAILGADTLAVLRQYMKNSVTVKYAVALSLSGVTMKWISCLKEPSRVQKTTFLGDLLSHFHQSFRMVIFANERVTADNICQFVSNITASVKVVHDGITPDVVAATLEEFRSDGLRVLVATDVLLRSVNIPSVDYVLHFDLPRKFTTYCGRVRLAQSGKKAVVYNLLAKQDHIVSAHIAHQLGLDGLEVPQLLEQLALNWKPYRDSRNHGKEFVTLVKECKEVEVAMRGASSKSKGVDSAMDQEAAGAAGTKSPYCQAELLAAPDARGSTGSDESDAECGRQYGAEDALSSDDELEVVPKRQLVKSGGLIDLEKVKQRRLKMMQEMP